MGAVAHNEKTVSDSAVDLSTELAAAVALHAAVNRVEVNVVDEGIRYTLDGTTPTATKGIYAPAGQTFEVRGYGNIAALQMIRNSADTEIEVTFFAE